MTETITLFGREISLFFFCWFLGIIFSFVTGWYIRKYYGFSFSRATILVALDMIIGFLLIWIMSWISGSGKMNGLNFARIVPVVPIFFALLAHLFREPPEKIFDFFAPITAVIYTISHLGCISAGCCHGYPSQWGLYSNIAQTICFPIQPIESLINLAIAIVLFWMVRKEKQQGLLYIWYMIFFGATRFITEFLRDNTKVWRSVSEFALYALASLTLGIIALMAVKHFSKGSCTNEKM